MRRSTETLPKDALDLLRRTDLSLARTMAAALGAEPRLQVVRRSRLDPPHPAWVAPPLAADASLLERRTGYRLGAVELSRNLAYVDLGRLGPAVADGLRAGGLTVGDVLTGGGFEKVGWAFGTDAEAGDMDGDLRDPDVWGEGDLGRYAWRRYAAWRGGQAAFVVIEALPFGTWERLLRSARLKGDSG